MSKRSLHILSMILVAGIGIMLVTGVANKGTPSPDVATQNIEMRDGVQYITINARGGYSPELTVAKANTPTKLIVKTNGTFDCSSALVIRSIGYQKILPQTGEEVIDLGTQEVNRTLTGTCSMGMYNFKIAFSAT